MLEMIHAHWKRQEVCKVRCRGVPTVDMDNVCYHLEEKTGGKIIHRIGGVVFLFRGRNYNPRTRPRYPIMLWKPAAPVYPKLIQDAPEGLTKEDADEFRRKGQKLLPICKLAKNGIYLNLVKDVRDAFEGSPLVKINCQGMHASDYKKIGAKLKELVPCVLLSFDEEQILMWRGHGWQPRYRAPTPSISKVDKNDTSALSDAEGSSSGIGDESTTELEASKPKMFLLWKQAIDSHKALLIDENAELTPDSLLERVEEFQGMSQAAEHSYPALILRGGEDTNNTVKSNDNDEVDDTDETSEDNEDREIDLNDSFEEVDPWAPHGSLPVDVIAERGQV
ncbi:uncharacterized protein A4U43_C08F32150 [Asparagus officinalis]|nr:uncharacterized protein A4U43_C08F32150 [Asparagus officinalis]